MARWRFITTGFAAGLAVSPALALACAATRFEPSATATLGGNCALRWPVDPNFELQLSEAHILAPGIVYQQAAKSIGCSADVTHVVQDCRSGEVMSIGSSRSDGMYPETLTAIAALSDELQNAAQAPDFTLAEVRRIGTAHGMIAFDSTTTGGSLRVAGKSMAMDCGCKTLFPELGGQE